MNMLRFAYYLLMTGLAAVLVSTNVIAEETTEGSSQSNPGSFMTFKNYPDHAFNAKEYIKGMEKGGHNLLIWKDSSANLSIYSSVKLTEFDGRLLPVQNVFSYDPYVALFNSVFKSSLKPPQNDSPDALLIQGAVVECNPGSRAARYMVGFGAGKAACAAVCEIYEPGKSNSCIRIYTRDTGSMGAFGGDSVAMLNHIMTEIASRLATTVNTTVGR